MSPPPDLFIYKITYYLYIELKFYYYLKEITMNVNMFTQMMDNPYITNMINLLRDISNTVRLYPQHEKFSLAKETRDSAKKMIRNYLLSMEIKSKSTYLLSRSQENLFDLLVLIKLAYELRYIPMETFTRINQHLYGINRLIRETILSKSDRNNKHI